MGRTKRSRPHPVSESIDSLYYNHLLDVLRQQQEAGTAYYGKFVYEPRPVAPEQYATWQNLALALQSAMQQQPATTQTQAPVSLPSKPYQSQPGQVARHGLATGTTSGAWPTSSSQSFWASQPHPMQDVQHVPGYGRIVATSASQSAPSVRANVSEAQYSAPSVQRLGSIGVSLVHSGTKPGPATAGSTQSGYRARTSSQLATGQATAAGVTPGAQGSLTVPDGPAEVDFPAARMAEEFLAKARKSYVGTPYEGRWKDAMIQTLESNATLSLSGRQEKLTGGPFSEQEDCLLLVARYVHGNRWNQVEKVIPGRSASVIKKHWHSALRERYQRAGWCSSVLAPPADSTFNPRTKQWGDEYVEQEDGPLPPAVPTGWPALAANVPGSGGWLAGTGIGYAPGAAARNAQVSDVAGSGSRHGEAGRDLGTRRKRHLEYVHDLPAREVNCNEKGERESVCFVCKAETIGQVAQCGWGHPGSAEGLPAKRPCWKVFHTTCLGPGGGPREGLPWHCRRHQCVTAGCQAVPVYECRSCPNSFCSNHRPATWRQAGDASRSDSLIRIVCPTCQAIEGTFSTGGPRVAQKQKTPVKGINLEASHEAASWQEMGEEEEEEEWMQLVESIRPLPTNNGGPIVDRIKRAITLAKDDPLVRRDVVDAMHESTSTNIYKSNSAGASKHMALQALDLHRQRIGRKIRGTTAIAPRPSKRPS